VRETFASHSSSLSKASLVRGDPLLDGKRYILRAHRSPFGQLGNTDLRPFWLPLGDNSGTHQATGVAHHLLFPIGGGSACFLAIRHLADVGISGALPPALAFSAFSRLRLLPCLTVGATTTERGPRAQLFHVLHSIQEDLGPLCYTGSPVSSRRATLDNPDSTACHFGWSLNQPRMAPCSYSACERSVNLTMSSDSSSLPV